MNHFDVSFFYWLNGLARLYKGFDQFMVFLVSNNFLKGGVLVMVLWWYWFRDRTVDLITRKKVLLTLFSCLMTLAFIRVIIMMMPFRSRPMHDPGLTYITPYGLDPAALEDFSTFPSDHAGLFFALATGIFFISRRVGIAAIIYVLCFICFPRLYLGYHYFSDILAGIAIGAASTILVMKVPVKRSIVRAGINWSIRAPASFYTGLFFITYMIAVLFDPLRQMGSFVMSVVF